VTDYVKSLKVTVLADNSVAAGQHVLAEHGLSLLVEADGSSLVFDVGASGIFLGNAARMGLDLASARKIIVSHGHYDHGGALGVPVAAFGPREIIAHPDVFREKYARRRGQKPRSIGLQWTSADLARRGAVLNLDSHAQHVAPGILTTGSVARTTDFETIPSHFAVRAGERLRRDSFVDEQGLIVRTREGLVILVGCSHRGVVNTLRHAIKMTGVERVHALIGGTHLGSADDRQLEKTAGELRRLRMAYVVACHCTGFRAATRLAAALGDSFNPGGVGYRFTL
jgi:7,8-dihydropterin-6-yl-methyl-4-(beta-D-ribofuranosyl)aminobenzene 5'-phosphate synthase